MNAGNPLRIGVLGAAGIFRKKNWQAIHASGNAIVAAIATRDPARSRELITDRQALFPFPDPPTAHGTYEELLADPSIEAVYLPLPTALRKTWVLRAAAAGKHILSEKPAATGADELHEMLAACRANHVQFMDGVMFDHHPRMDHLRDLLDHDARIGPVRRITSAFSFLGTTGFHTENIRIHAGLEPAGCLGDLGWYCLRFTLWAMRYERPVSATGRILATSPDGTPTDFSGELHFANGASAGFHCSFHAQHQQWANISGSHGALRVPDFVLPASDNPTAWAVNYESTPKSAIPLALDSTTTPESQEALMFRNFAAQARCGVLNENWFKAAWETQRTMDACLASARAEGRTVRLDD
jgi:predicted dehydrogenase